jgi:hypothetical protein
LLKPHRQGDNGARKHSAETSAAEEPPQSAPSAARTGKEEVMADRRTWPYGNHDPVLNRNAPEAYFTSSQGYHRSDRDVAGPLRTGTTPEAGPKGTPVRADRDFTTDYGMDRIDPTAGRDINKGSSQPPPPYKSTLIARKIRGRADD